MLRQICAILLLLAMTGLGGASHAAMQDQHAMCGQEHRSSGHCSARDQTMDAACITACLGSTLPQIQSVLAAPRRLLVLDYPATPAPLWQGRVGEAAERPPKSV